MIVDTHAHVLSGETDRYPVAPVNGVRSEWSTNLTLSGEQLLALMNEAGVAAATVVQASTVYGNDNSFVADSMALAPDRLAGVGGIDPRLPDARELLRFWVTERGLAGMRVFASGANASWLDAAALDPFWDEVCSLGIPLNLQVRFGDVRRLAAIAERHPALTIIVDNLAVAPLAGGPPYAAAQELFALARFPALMLKYTNSNLNVAGADSGDARDLLFALAEVFSADRIMWGSNYPTVLRDGEITYRALVDAARRSVERCSVSQQAAILGGTAARLYGLTTTAR